MTLSRQRSENRSRKPYGEISRGEERRGREKRAFWSTDTSFLLPCDRGTQQAIHGPRPEFFRRLIETAFARPACGLIRGRAAVSAPKRARASLRFEMGGPLAIRRVANSFAPDSDAPDLDRALPLGKDPTWRHSTNRRTSRPMSSWASEIGCWIRPRLVWRVAGREIRIPSHAARATRGRRRY
jgi:hypothetical protein